MNDSLILIFYFHFEGKWNQEFLKKASLITAFAILTFSFGTMGLFVAIFVGQSDDNNESTPGEALPSNI